MDGFLADESYNCSYTVNADTKVSALAFLLLLDERHSGDPNLMFRPGRAGTNGSRKLLLRYETSDIPNKQIPHLRLRNGEIQGWNVYGSR